MLARSRKSITISLYYAHFVAIIVHSYSEGTLASPTLITRPRPCDFRISVGLTTSLLIVQNQGIIFDPRLSSSRSCPPTSPVSFESGISCILPPDSIWKNSVLQVAPPGLGARLPHLLCGADGQST